MDNPREQLNEIRRQMLNGAITYDEALTLTKPIIEHINRRGKEIAKEHGFKFKPMGFSYLMR